MGIGEAYRRLFAGRTDAYGIGEGGVVHAPLTPEIYRGHYQGESAIGVFPLLDDGTCRFAVVDIDKPNYELAQEFQKLIPGRSWIERSRSGNYHVWVFFKAPIEAWIPRAILKEIAEILGEPRIEIFPKQDFLGDGMVGNYINLPYFGPTQRPFVTDELIDLDFHAAIFAAYTHRNDPDAWRRRADYLGLEPVSRPAGSGQTTKVLHCCAEKMIAERETNPVLDGGRHVVLFNLAKQLHAYEAFSDDEVWSYLNLVNDCAQPPLSRRELRTIFKNAKGYYSTGCDDPLMAPYVDPNCPILRKGDHHGSVSGLRV
jgi:hypothetical protein